MTEATQEASSLVHSTAALRDRAAKAGLSREEVDAIIDSGVTSMAQMAFAISPQVLPPQKAKSDPFIREELL